MCVCASRHGGKGVSGGMNQPLSSATRPLTYRARFSKTQRSTLTLSRISLSLLAISHWVNKELFQSDVRNRGGRFVSPHVRTHISERALSPPTSVLPANLNMTYAGRAHSAQASHIFIKLVEVTDETHVICGLWGLLMACAETAKAVSRNCTSRRRL